jgi:hypothetical protein
MTTAAVTRDTPSGFGLAQLLVTLGAIRPHDDKSLAFARGPDRLKASDTGEKVAAHAMPPLLRQ